MTVHALFICHLFFFHSLFHDDMRVFFFIFFSLHFMSLREEATVTLQLSEKASIIDTNVSTLFCFIFIFFLFLLKLLHIALLRRLFIASGVIHFYTLKCDLFLLSHFYSHKKSEDGEER